MNVKVREKEFEEIKWQYWNKSNSFKLLWRYYRAKKLNPSTPFPDKFKNDEMKKTFQAAREYWLYWVNHEPETASFDDYWNFKEEVRRAFAGDKNRNKYIEDYREVVTRDIDRIINRFKRIKNRKPRLDELRENLILEMTDSRHSVLKIYRYDFTETEDQEIQKQIMRSLKKNHVDSANFHPEALKQYLKAWELRKESNPKKPLVEIYELIKEKGVTIEDKAGKAFRCIEKADKIIENLEAGKKIWWNVKRERKLIE